MIYSNVSTEEMIAKGAVPVKEIIEKFNRDHGLSFQPQSDD